MTATRSRHEEKQYKESLQKSRDNGCPFCAITVTSDQIVEDGVAHKVIHNIFPYSLWDGQRVADHLMVVPKKHTDSLKSLTSREKIEYVDILSKYESRGYNVYARASQSTSKSIVHQHTHLIKLTSRTPRFVLLLRKPYLRLVSR